LKKKLPVYWGEEPGRRLVGTAKIISSTEAIIHIEDWNLLHWMKGGHPSAISIQPYTDDTERG